MLYEPLWKAQKFSTVVNGARHETFCRCRSLINTEQRPWVQLQLQSIQIRTMILVSTDLYGGPLCPPGSRVCALRADRTFCPQQGCDRMFRDVHHVPAPRPLASKLWALSFSMPIVVREFGNFSLGKLPQWLHFSQAWLVNLASVLRHTSFCEAAL